MIEFVHAYFNLTYDEFESKYVIKFRLKGDPPFIRRNVTLDSFIELFSQPIQKSIDNGTDIMDEIRAFDPENKLGYNNLIV